MQKSRLFKIIYYLLNKGFATAPELAQEMEVSVRTIYRDIDVLSSTGIPIYVTTGRNGGIHLMKNYVLDKTILSQKEKQDILSAVQNLSITSSDYTHDTLEKLSALFRLPADNWYEIDFSRWNSPIQDNKKFEILKKGIIAHLVVKIIYVNSYGIQDERNIQPLKLLYKSKEWYLKAFCMKKQDFRIFKLNRILSYELLQENFSPIPYPEVPVQEESYPAVRLRFNKDVAYRVYDEFEESLIEKQDNGDFIVSAQMPVDSWLLGYLLSFGTQVEVLKPLSLRKLIVEQAAKIYELYKP